MFDKIFKKFSKFYIRKLIHCAIKFLEEILSIIQQQCSEESLLDQKDILIDSIIETLQKYKKQAQQPADTI